jgi:hypothetical protein
MFEQKEDLAIKYVKKLMVNLATKPLIQQACLAEFAAVLKPLQMLAVL